MFTFRLLIRVFLADRSGWIRAGGRGEVCGGEALEQRISLSNPHLLQDSPERDVPAWSCFLSAAGLPWRCETRVGGTVLYNMLSLPGMGASLLPLILFKQSSRECAPTLHAVSSFVFFFSPSSSPTLALSHKHTRNLSLNVLV